MENIITNIASLNLILELIILPLVVLSLFFIGFTFCAFGWVKVKSAIEVIVLGLAFCNIIFYLIPPFIWAYPFLVLLGLILFILYRSRQKLVYWHLWLVLPPLLILLIPLLKLGYLSSIKNVYTYFMISAADYYKTHPYWHIPSWDYYHPHLYMLAERLSYRLVTGSNLFLAAISNTFYLPVWKLYYLLSCLVSFCPVILFVSLKKVDKHLAWFCYLLTVFSFTYLKWPVDGQLTMCLGMVLLIYVFFARADLGFVFSFGGLFCCYPPLIPYGFLGPVAKSLLNRSLVKKYLICIFLSLIISPWLIFFLITKGIEVYQLATYNWDNIPGILNLAQLIGLKPHFAPTTFFSKITSYLSIAFLIIGFIFCLRQKKLRVIAISFLICVLGALYFLVIRGAQYLYYKHIVVCAFLFFAIFGAGFSQCWHKYKREFSHITIAIILTFFVFQQLRATSSVYRANAIKQGFINLGFFSFLENVNDQLPKDKIALVLPNSVYDAGFIAYKLKEKKLSIPQISEPWGWWVFSSVKGRGEKGKFYHKKADYIIAPALLAQGQILLEKNGFFFLYKPISYIETGLYDLEIDHSGYFRWSKDKIKIVSLASIASAKLRLIFRPLTNYSIKIKTEQKEDIYNVKPQAQKLEVDVGEVLPGDEITISILKIKSPSDLGIFCEERQLGLALKEFGLFPK